MFIATKESPLPRAVRVGAGEPDTIEQPYETAPRGLSRQRKDFDKALGILENAASSDERLSSYFTRLQKRVRGKASMPEIGSGVRVIERETEDDQVVVMEPLSARGESEAAPDQSPIKNVLAKLKGFMGSPMVEDSRTADPAPAAEIKVAADREQAADSYLLTVGDVTFEMNPAIERWIDYYTESQRGRQTMQIGINRSGSYLDLARAEFQRLDVPEDLVWLAHVESVWHMTAMSPAAAGGLWQFIPSTAKDYGLTVSQQYDERLDPVKQTRVAAEYLRDLYTIFGDWALAMAAYNCGEPRVMQAIVRNGRADFWELHQKQLLPRETLNYVPKILAAIEVASRAESYGFSSD
ncbi:MAG TPA: lytic transglycosylase domain-containing protein, partial [Blastocatellia bacterium]|nr:lytic transglycosylase domain-containing protein [Blastocatellia bacterium]